MNDGEIAGWTSKQTLQLTNEFLDVLNSHAGDAGLFAPAPLVHAIHTNALLRTLVRVCGTDPGTDEATRLVMELHEVCEKFEKFEEGSKVSPYDN